MTSFGPVVSVIPAQARPDFVNLFEAVAEAAWRDLYVNRIGAYRDLLK